MARTVRELEAFAVSRGIQVAVPYPVTEVETQCTALYDGVRCTRPVVSSDWCAPCSGLMNSMIRRYKLADVGDRGTSVMEVARSLVRMYPVSIPPAHVSSLLPTLRTIFELRWAVQRTFYALQGDEGHIKYLIWVSYVVSKFEQSAPLALVGEEEEEANEAVEAPTLASTSAPVPPAPMAPAPTLASTSAPVPPAPTLEPEPAPAPAPASATTKKKKPKSASAPASALAPQLRLLRQLDFSLDEARTLPPHLLQQLTAVAPFLYQLVDTKPVLAVWFSSILDALLQQVGKPEVAFSMPMSIPVSINILLQSFDPAHFEPYPSIHDKLQAWISIALERERHITPQHRVVMYIVYQILGRVIFDFGSIKVRQEMRRRWLSFEIWGVDMAQTLPESVVKNPDPLIFQLMKLVAHGEAHEDDIFLWCAFAFGAILARTANYLQTLPAVEVQAYWLSHNQFAFTDFVHRLLLPLRILETSEDPIGRLLCDSIQMVRNPILDRTYRMLLNKVADMRRRVAEHHLRVPVQHVTAALNLLYRNEIELDTRQLRISLWEAVEPLTHLVYQYSLRGVSTSSQCVLTELLGHCTPNLHPDLTNLVLFRHTVAEAEHGLAWPACAPFSGIPFPIRAALHRLPREATQYDISTATYFYAIWLVVCIFSTCPAASPDHPCPIAPRPFLNPCFAYMQLLRRLPGGEAPPVQVQLCQRQLEAVFALCTVALMLQNHTGIHPKTQSIALYYDVLNEADGGEKMMTCDDAFILVSIRFMLAVASKHRTAESLPRLERAVRDLRAVLRAPAMLRAFDTDVPTDDMRALVTWMESTMQRQLNDTAMLQAWATW